MSTPQLVGPRRSDPRTHPIGRWFAGHLASADPVPTDASALYGITVIDLAAEPGEPMARSTFLGTRNSDRGVLGGDNWSAASFDAVVVVDWFGGAAVVTELFVNP